VSIAAAEVARDQDTISSSEGVTAPKYGVEVVEGIDLSTQRRESSHTKETRAPFAAFPRSGLLCP